MIIYKIALIHKVQTSTSIITYTVTSKAQESLGSNSAAFMLNGTFIHRLFTEMVSVRSHFRHLT